MLRHSIDIWLMAFEYEVYAIYKFPGNFYDSLTCNHSLAIIEIAQLHSLIVSYCNPCSLNNAGAKNGVLTSRNVPRTIMLTA